MAIDAHKMATRTTQWFQERPWDAPTKGLAWYLGAERCIASALFANLKLFGGMEVRGWGLVIRVEGSGFKGSGFRVQGSGFRVQILGLRVDRLREGFRESRKSSRDTYPESYITEYTLVYQDQGEGGPFEPPEVGERLVQGSGFRAWV